MYSDIVEQAPCVRGMPTACSCCSAVMPGYEYVGGKEDDITVVAAWVLQDAPFVL